MTQAGPESRHQMLIGLLTGFLLTAGTGQGWTARPGQYSMIGLQALADSAGNLLPETLVSRSSGWVRMSDGVRPAFAVANCTTAAYADCLGRRAIAHVSGCNLVRVRFLGE